MLVGAVPARSSIGYGAAADCPGLRLSEAQATGDHVGGSTIAPPRLHRAGQTVASPANPSRSQARISEPRRRGMPLMTDRIREFLALNREDGPRLVVDLEVVRENYQNFASALPDTRVFYAVKANPAPEILSLLAGLGSSFDTASIAEIELALAAGATPDRVSFGNTIKKEKDVARAHALGVRLYAVDCEAEVEKIARAAPGSKVFCRILCDGAGAEWPLSRKFGCAPQMAAKVLERAHALGLVAHGLSFHVGSQQRHPRAWTARWKSRPLSSVTSPSAASSFRCSTSAAASRRAISSMSRLSAPMDRRSFARSAATSATAFRRRSSSPAAAWSATPGSSRRRWC
jgi:hypothetical protein